MFDYLSKINISRASLTPLGRVVKIHLKIPHEIGKFFVRQRQLIFNIQSSKIVV